MKQLTQVFTATSLAVAFATSAFAAPETYGVEPDHTYANFSYNHMGLSTQISKFSKTSGTVVYDKAAKTGSVDVTIDMKSVDTGSTLFNGHIQGADFLDTEKFPTATFVSTDVRPSGDDYKLVGDFTLKGVTKQVELDLEFNGQNPGMGHGAAAGFEANTVINRKDFGIDIEMPLEGGGVVVGDKITITLEIEAVQPS